MRRAPVVALMVLWSGAGIAQSSAVSRADALIASHQYQQAESLLIALLKHEPKNAAALNNMGRIRAAQGRAQEAGDFYAQAVAAKPDDLPALLNLGNWQGSQKLYDDALKSFEAALKLAPTDPVAREGEVHAAIAAALETRAAGDMNGALAYLVRARKVVPNDPELLLDFGVQADTMRIYQDADAALTQAHTLAPQNEKILYALAHVELDEQKMPQAEANLEAYLKAKPDDASAHYGLGHLLHMEQKDDAAQSELNASIRLAPQQIAAYYELGEIALEQGQADAARENFEKVLTVDPSHGGALTGLGILALRARDNADAEKYLKQATLYAPDYAEAHRYYAMLLARTGRQAESQEEAARARQLTEQENRLSKGYVLESPPKE